MGSVFLKLAFCFLFCAFLDVEAQITPEELQEWEDSHKVSTYITRTFSQKIYKDKGLVTIGTGGGAEEGSSKGLTLLSITVECHKKFNIQEARKLLLECVDEYVAEINKHEEFKKHAYSFPFDFRNANITILFKDRTTKKFYPPPCLCSASAEKGELSYCMDPNPKGPLQQILTETYEEACLLLK